MSVGLLVWISRNPGHFVAGLTRKSSPEMTEGAEHHNAQALLRSRYPQLEKIQISQHPVIAGRIERAMNWGNLSVAEMT